MRLLLQPPRRRSRRRGRFFAELSAAVEELSQQRQKRNERIRGRMWNLLDQYSFQCKKDRLSIVQGCHLGRCIKTLLQSNCG